MFSGPVIQCNSNLKCQNGGYPHPKNCGECLCPDGFIGLDCNQVYPGTRKFMLKNF